MEINTINGHTRTLGAPSNWDQSKGECAGLPIMDQDTENGPCMISEWQPEAHDLQLLNMGMPIHLWVFAETHPVVSISVGQPTQEPIDQAISETQITNAQLHGCASEGWQCFHCGEIFKTVGGALDHFGSDPSKEPGCAIRVKHGDERGLEMELRKTEAERDKLQYQISNESTEADLRMQSMQSDHQIALRREEEKGYARGLADGLKLPDQVRPAIDELLRIARTKAAGWEPVATVKKWLDNLDQGLTTPSEASIGKLTMVLHTSTALLRKSIVDLIECDDAAAHSVNVAQYRAKFIRAMEKKLADNILYNYDIAIMPRELTAENGAKAAMMGEFFLPVQVSCNQCDNEGTLSDGTECADCEGTGVVVDRETIDWTTIKAIYKKAVEVCEVKSIS